MIEIQYLYKLIMVFLYAAFATYVSFYYLKRKFLKKGFFVFDMYKKEKPKVANLGGMCIWIGILVSIVLSQLLLKEFSTEKLLVFYFVVFIHATFGLLDDLINLSQKIKIIAPFFMALPIALLNTDTTFNLIFITLNLGLIMVYLLAPLFLMVVTNLTNTHSGYNGLASGLSLLLLFFLGVRSVLLADYTSLYFLMPVFGAVFIWTLIGDRYPAKMIWGNVGSLMVGSAIAAYMVLTRAYIFGLIILIPHIFDFLLFVYSVTFGKKKFDNIKFGKLRKDGTIIAPTKYKLKFLLPYYFKLSEKRTTLVLYALTFVFGVIGILLNV
ncbi:MAG: hypothetical protein ABIB47_01620 [Candidatus Woesearchaeota archaeon]